MRDLTITKILSLLKAKGFAVSTFLNINSCFDLIARHEKLVLAVKVLTNIDSFRPGQAEELKKVARVFGLNALIVGEKTKAFGLRDSLVYERHGIPVLTIGSFKGLLEAKIPYIKYFKGREIVSLDPGKLKSLRRSRGLSLAELAEAVSVSRETLHRFESGHSTSLETAKRLEGYFNSSLIKKPDLLDKEASLKKACFDDSFADPLLQKVHDLGLRMAVFEHAPFKAVANPKDTFLFSFGSGRSDVVRKAIELSKASSLTDSRPFIIAKSFKKESAEHVPVVSEEELAETHKYQELLKLVRERREKANE